MSDENFTESRPPSYGSIGSTSAEHYKWDILILGATGWCAVFLVRKPTFFIFSKLISLKVSTSSILTLFFIGFIEELVRMGWLYYFVGEVDKFLMAYWLGLGWATGEAIFFIIQNFIELRWYRDDLEMDGSRYVEERSEIEEILGRPLTKISAWWGVMWRFSWIMIHIGFSCWIASISLLVYPAALIHGLLLVVWGYCLPSFGIPATSYGTLLISMTIFLIGLALFGQIV
ncbi:9080_t:CDS:2 [Funneliformis mosseae]|uniref:9080_t:CDS:1 n=1 Tax=Funneliformis mosseae TaxID=27381 RepID=A0A9N9GHR5_FUNMO|nr:9080_t:CDS:2 [Funneliformis mosseae]